MEQLPKLEKLVKEYGAVARAIAAANSLAELDELKLQGSRLIAETARQVNRVQMEFTQGSRQKRAEITTRRYNEVITRKTIKVEAEEEKVTEVKVSRKPKAKKAKK